MNYELKDKINVTNELLTELEMKGWQEIEYLQAQIANLAESAANNRLRQLLKNLLTSYYVFTGGIENMESEPVANIPVDAEMPINDSVLLAEPEILPDKKQEAAVDIDYAYIPEQGSEYEVSDPFEYFTDFDDPVGEPITDEDLYAN